MECEILRSNRKKLALQLKKDRLMVFAPLNASEEDIQCFVESQRDWIEKNLAKWRQWQEREKEWGSIHRLTKEELAELKQRTAELIAERVKVWAPIVGVDYGKITINKTRSAWGKCRSNGDLFFNCLLALVPPLVCDSVVVHELCHLLLMDHSKFFYGKVLSFFPE